MVKCPHHELPARRPLTETGEHGGGGRTLMKPMSFAYWRKHWRHILRPYFRIRPCRFEQTRLRGKRWRYRKSLKAKYSALGRPPPALPAGLHGPITGLQWRQPQLRFRLPPPRRPRAPPQYISSSVAPQSNPFLKLHSVSHQEREPWPNFLGWLQYSCWCPKTLTIVTSEVTDHRSP